MKTRYRRRCAWGSVAGGLLLVGACMNTPTSQVSEPYLPGGVDLSEVLEQALAPENRSGWGVSSSVVVNPQEGAGIVILYGVSRSDALRPTTPLDHLAALDRLMRDALHRKGITVLATARGEKGATDIRYCEPQTGGSGWLHMVVVPGKDDAMRVVLTRVEVRIETGCEPDELPKMVS